jgi:hypothetical protein
MTVFTYAIVGLAIGLGAVSLVAVIAAEVQTRIRRKSAHRYLVWALATMPALRETNLDEVRTFAYEPLGSPLRRRETVGGSDTPAGARSRQREFLMMLTMVSGQPDVSVALEDVATDRTLCEGLLGALRLLAEPPLNEERGIPFRT